MIERYDKLFLSYAKRLIFRLPNYVSAFGFWGGVRALLTVEHEWPQHSQKERSFTLPGLGHRISVRKAVGDHSIVWQCLVQRQYRLDKFKQNERVMRHYVTEVDAGRRPLIIDGGANIGLATIWFAKTFPEATLVAIEPDESNYDLLVRNTAYYETRVKRIRGGLWSRAGRLRITNPEAGTAAYRVAYCDSSEPDSVPAYTIPDILANNPDHFLFFVKLDIEGSQKFLFSNNTNWISQALVIAIELDDWLIPWWGSSTPVLKSLSQYDFDYVLSGETLFCFRHVPLI